jgi:hypothetical protein
MAGILQDPPINRDERTDLNKYHVLPGTVFMSIYDEQYLSSALFHAYLFVQYRACEYRSVHANTGP